MEDVLLLENPRRRARSRRRRTPPRRADGRFRKGGGSRRKATKRRRRRNPVLVRAKRRNPRRRRARATTRRRAPAARRRRRRNPSRGRGGGVLKFNRARSIVMDGASLALAEFGGDILARLLLTKGPQARFLVTWLDRYVGANVAMSQKWVQLALAVLAGPTLRRFKFIPNKLLHYWELGNAASAIIGLTYGWRQQAYDQLQLSGYGGGGRGRGLSDWVTSARSAPALPPPGDVIDGLYGLSDWATVAGSASYTGDPFSM